MDIVIKPGYKATTKQEIEQVQQEKQEYFLIGTYIRTRGLTLYAYDSQKNEIQEVSISHHDTLTLTQDENGISTAPEKNATATVDTRNIHFEALNMKNAERRVQRWKQGKIKELCNLRKKKDFSKYESYY